MKYIQTHAAKRTNFPRESPWRGRGWSIAEEPDACSASNGRIGGDDTDVSWITVAAPPSLTLSLSLSSSGSRAQPNRDEAWRRAIGDGRRSWCVEGWRLVCTPRERGEKEEKKIVPERHLAPLPSRDYHFEIE